MNNEIKESVKLIKIAIYGLVMAAIGFTALILTSCAQIDFSKKAIALEETVFAIDLTMPSTILSEAAAVVKLRAGFWTTKYASAPVGSTVLIDKEYNDISLWNMTGTVTTKIEVNHGVSKTFPEDAPVKK